MDKLCTRCARHTLSQRVVINPRAQVATRHFSASPHAAADEGSRDSGVARSGRPLGDALGKSNSSSNSPPKLVIRRTSEPERSSPLRRTSGTSTGTAPRRPPSGADGQSRPPGQGLVIRRSSPPQGGQFLRRAGPPGASQGGYRGGAAGGRPPGQRPPGSLLIKRTGQGQGQGGRPGQQGTDQRGQKGPDRRRRVGPKQPEEEVDQQALGEKMEEYIAKYVDRPDNPSQPITYNPTRLTLDDLKSDWPTTPISASGMTESVIQKIEWLSRRLPHGYQSPEQIAEHYLKGNLTRFESEEEKQQVIKLASELSAKTKRESDEGTLHKHETPRFAIVENPEFTSMASKAEDKNHLVNTGVKGDYGQVAKHQYAFMQNAGRMLNNNETYGPVQAAKFLARVQALIPQTRSGGASQAKRA